MRTLLLLVAGCSGGVTSDDPSDTSPTGDTGQDTTPITDTRTGACGDVTVWGVTLVGTVIGADGNPAIGADVWVEDRGWTPGTVLGTATTDAYGAFSVELAEVTSVEDCWATLLDYVLVGERPGERGEKDLNTELFNAIENGTFAADLGPFPLRLESTL